MKTRILQLIFTACFLIIPLSIFSQQLKFAEANILISGAELIIKGKSNQGYSFVRMSDQRPVATTEALNWLKTSVLKCRPDDELKEIRNEIDNLGFTHFRYQQYYSGIPVIGGEYLAHIKNGKVVSANGAYFENISIKIHPDIDSLKALELSLQHVDSKKLFGEVNPAPQLVIVTFTADFRLAYKTTIYSLDPLKHINLYLDANTGEIIFEENLITDVDVQGTAETIYSGTQAITTNQLGPGSYMLNESTRNIRTRTLYQETDFGLASEIGDTDNIWNNTAGQINSAYDLHYGLEKTYDYFLNTFGRNSFDNAGHEIDGYANYGYQYNNAFWDQSHLAFGDGDGLRFTPLTSLQVVGHEYTHAVTTYTAGLYNFMDPGALNESFSDIFGTVIDFKINPTTANYQIGGSISVSGLPFRSMSSPKDFGSPDTYLGQFWDYGWFFGGNTHINNGPANYYFYLLSEGGSGINDNADNYFVSPIGRDEAAAIAFRTLTRYLTSGSFYMDARNASIQAAIDLFGPCSHEVVQVTNAWYAVGLGTPYTDAVVAGFEIPQSTYCHIPAIIQFTNHSTNAVSSRWDFGDGATSTSPDPVHTYSTTGSYVTRLIVNGTSICNSADTFSMTINISSGGPVAASCQPQPVSPCCMTGIYKIDLNDLHNSSGSAEEGYRDFTCTKIAHLVAGQNYPVTGVTGTLIKENLKAWIDYNNDGVFDNVHEFAFESNNKLRFHSANIYTPVNCVLNTPVRFRIISDIAYNDINSPCYQPINGQVEDYSIIFSLNTLPPVADFTSSATSVHPGQVLNFFDRSLHVPLNWTWEFSGGSPAFSSSQNPSVSYLFPGDYEVKLKVANSFGSDSILRIAYVHVANHYFMCNGPASSGEFNGELDNYPLNLYSVGISTCTFQVSLPCTTDIHFNFNHFNIGQNAFLKIYDGQGYSAPLIFSATYDSLPAILPVAHSGSAFIVFSINIPYYNLDTTLRFNMTWSASLSQIHIPFAAFNSSNSSPPVNSPVQFTDVSSNAIHHTWDFGDGSGSIAANPIHNFISQGNYPVLLITESCTGIDTVTHIIHVQPPPDISYHPHQFDTTLTCGTSISLPLTITNSGPGDLLVNIQSPLSTPEKIRVLVLGYGARPEDEIPNALNSSSNYCDFSATIYTGADPVVLESLLHNKDVILVPGNYFDKPFKYLGLGPVVRSFVERGGGIIFLNGSPDNLGNFHSLGLLHPTGYRMSYGWDTLPTSSHPMLNNVNHIFQLPSYTHSLTFEDPDLIKLITSYGYDILSYRYEGSGKVIFLAFDYYVYNGNDILLHPEASQLIANAFKWASKPHQQILQIIPPANSISLQPGDSISIPITVQGIYPGSQSTFIILNTNQPSHTADTIFINTTVTGSPMIQLLATCVHFPSTEEFTKRIDTLRFINTGCGDLLIDSVASSIPDFRIKSFTAMVAEGDTGAAVVEFNPVHTGFLNSTFNIHSNIPLTTFCADGNATTAPALSLNTDSLVFNLTCNNNVSTPVTITNTGGGTLFVSSNPHTATSNALRILIFNGSILTQGSAALYNSIRQSCPDCILNYINYFNESYISSALVGTDVFIVGPTSLMSAANPAVISPVIKNFVNAGGDVVFWNQSNPNHYFTGDGIIHGYVYGTSTGAAVDVIDPSFPALSGFLPHFLTTQTSYVTQIQTENKIPLIGLQGNDYTMYLKSGKGFAYYVAHNLWHADTLTYKIIPGIIKTIKDGRLPRWISLSSDSMVINAGGSFNLGVTFNIQGMPAGQYSGDIVFNSNTHPLAYDTIHCKINITGNESIALSQSCITFDTVFTGNHSLATIKIYNTGCDTLFLSSIHCQTATFGTYPPYILPLDSSSLNMQFTAINTGQNFDTLVILNSAHDTSVCMHITGLNPPVISHHPDSIVVTLNCSDTTTVSLNITNSGLTPLHYSTNHAYDGDTIQVTFLTVEPERYYFNQYIIPGILHEYPKSRFKIVTSTNLDTVEKELRTTDVLIVAWYAYQSDSTQFFQYAPLVGQFGMNGGTVLFTFFSTMFSTFINATGLFHMTLPGISNQGDIPVVNPNHPLAEGLPYNIPTAYNVPLIHLTDSDKVSVAAYSGYDLFAFRYTGHGTSIIFSTTDLYSSTSSTVIANAIRWAGTRSHGGWLHVIPPGNILAPSSSASLTININSQGLVAGTYSTNIVIASNDPLYPFDSVPVHLYVFGNPTLSISDSCINFGNVQVNTTVTKQFLVKNTGCDTLFIDSISLPVFVQAGIENDTLLPGDSTYIMMNFYPVNSGTYNTLSTIYTNAGDTTICLHAVIETDPSYSCSQNSIQVTLGCSDSVIVSVTISNLQGGNLHVKVLPPGRILVLTYGVDTISLLPTLISSIRQYYSSFRISYLNTTDISVLNAAVANCDLVMYPQTSYSDIATITSFNGVLDNYVQNGGMLISFGSGDRNAGFCTTHLGSDWTQDVFGAPMDIYDQSTPLTDSISTYIYSSGSAISKIHPYFTTIIADGYFYGTVVGYVYVGTGRAIYIGLDYSSPNTDESRIAANAVRWCIGSHNKSITSTPDSVILAGGTSATLNFQFSSIGFPAGIFEDTIIIQTNDPLHPFDSIPVLMNVIGQPAITASDTCLSFVDVPENDHAVQTFSISNPGCDTLLVSSFSSATGLFTAQPSSLSLAPGITKYVSVQFSPLSTGNYSDTLIVFSNGGNIKLCLHGSSVGSSFVTIAPSSFNLILNCHDTIIRQVTIHNNGNASLDLHIGTYALTDPFVSLTCLVYTFTEYNYITTSLQNYHNYFSNPIYFYNTDSASLARSLSRSDVITIGYVYGYSLTPSMNAQLKQFVRRGGTLIFLGSEYGGATVFNTDLFHGYFCNNFYAVIADVLEPWHPIADSISFPLSNVNSVIPAFQFSDPDKEKVLDYAGMDVLTIRNIGKGRAIYDAIPFYYSGTVHQKLFVNMIRWAGELSHQRIVHANNPYLTISQGDSAQVSLSFTAGNLNAGIYYDTLYFYSNDPAHVVTSIPYQYTVTGGPAIRLSTSCINYGQVMSTSLTQSATIFNDGCTTLNISAITHSDSAFSITAPFNHVNAWSGDTIHVTYNSTVPGIHTDTIHIHTSIGDTTICLYAQTGIPLSTFNPDSFYVTLGSCHDTVTLPLTYQNNGGSNLQLNLTNGAALGQRLEVLALTYGTDMGTEYPNTIAAIRNYITHFNLTEFNSNDTSALRIALNGKDVLLIPEPEYANPTDFTGMGIIMQEFASLGGTVIFCGANGNQSACLFNTGLFHGSFSANAGGDPLTLNLPGDPLAIGVDSVFTAPSGTYTVSISDTDKTEVVSYGANDVVTYRSIGAGKVIFLAFDYFLYNSNSSHLAANAIVTFASAQHHDWIDVNPLARNIPSGDSGIFQLTFTTASLIYGRHVDTLFIASNDPFHLMDTIICTLDVNQHFCADFGYNTSCDGLVSFLDSSSNNPTSWQWNFGDGGIATTRNPIHHYLLPGNYTVTLIASNVTDDDTIQYILIPHVTQQVSINDTGSVLQGGQIFFFSDDTTGVSRIWTFGDGTQSTVPNPAHTYSNHGVFPVTLTVTDAAGCIFSDSISIVIIDVAVIENPIPVSSGLFPNPCKDEAMLSYTLNKNTEVEISLYDLFGRKVKTIFNATEQSPGKYYLHIKFEIPGFYFVAVRQGNQQTILKIISLK